MIMAMAGNAVAIFLKEMCVAAPSQENAGINSEDTGMEGTL